MPPAVASPRELRTLLRERWSERQQTATLRLQALDGNLFIAGT
jgi:hypothetical protein